MSTIIFFVILYTVILLVVYLSDRKSKVIPDPISGKFKIVTLLISCGLIVGLLFISKYFPVFTFLFRLACSGIAIGLIHGIIQEWRFYKDLSNTIATSGIYSGPILLLLLFALLPEWLNEHLDFIVYIPFLGAPLLGIIALFLACGAGIQHVYGKFQAWRER